MKATTATRYWGHYVIRARSVAGTCQAQIFYGRTLIGPRHQSSNNDSAIKAAEDWLDQRAAGEALERQKTGIPSISAYKEAFNCIELNAGERAMLYAHFSAPWQKLTATELARAVGWANWSAANLHYGGLGRKIAEYVRWTPPLRADGTPI